LTALQALESERICNLLTYRQPLSQVVFKPPTNQKALSVREIKAEYLGKLVTLQGIVTRVTAVKPYVEVAAYTCESCGSENFQEVTARQFMPLTECNSQVCKTNQTKGKLHEQTRANKFLEFQEVKIQELVRFISRRHQELYLGSMENAPITHHLLFCITLL
jgi:DNA replication licensing factor MCM7